MMRYWAGVEGRTAVDLISIYGYGMVVWIPVAVRFSSLSGGRSSLLPSYFASRLSQLSDLSFQPQHSPFLASFSSASKHHFHSLVSF
jgi:hypothetical protein